MEKRLLLAIVLSFGVLFLYNLLFLKKEPPQQPVSEPVVEIEKALEQTPEPEIQAKPPEAPAEQEFQAAEAEEEQDVIVDTPLYRAVWNNRGAQLKSWRLKEYSDDQEENLELISSRSADLGRYPFLLLTDDAEFDNMINTVRYAFSRTNLELTGREEAELRFEFATETGTRVEKIFTFHGNAYDFDIQINLWRNGQKITPRIIWGPSFGNISAEEMKRRIGGGGAGVTVYAGNKVLRHEERKYKLENSLYNFADWVAYDSNYFAALFLAPQQKMGAAFLREDIDQIPSYFLALDLPERAFIGPKDVDRLIEFEPSTKKIIRFGFFGWMAEILHTAIKYIHTAVPNWGFSIIILTIIIKILFFPLTYSSTKSMAKMQELQPKMKAIRAKYKKAKQDIGQRRKMNEEIMKLYKEHGVNPAGGCLPMLIQLPIFWGFFRMLAISLEFRKSPFIFWIKDLSVHDPVYVTPILMGITQYISQKMTPTSADPTQQRMMMIMPVVMTIFFMNFSSGLVLYWLTNNVLQIGQQYIMNRLRKKQKSEAHGKKRKK
ncbi:MAG: membrane protein insertase YidC [Candidatus Aminicenantes bacterium]|nr:MAG: membrane protein insertase YidC [Candidatus Aminicenantes bacterium]